MLGGAGVELGGLLCEDDLAMVIVYRAKLNVITVVMGSALSIEVDLSGVKVSILNLLDAVMDIGKNLMEFVAFIDQLKGAI